MKQLGRAALVSLTCLVLLPLMPGARALNPPQQSFDLKANYTKSEQMIPMRDGVKLFTSIYTPKDTSQKYPIVLSRTPYSCSPYRPDTYKDTIGSAQYGSCVN